MRAYTKSWARESSRMTGSRAPISQCGRPTPTRISVIGDFNGWDDTARAGLRRRSIGHLGRLHSRSGRRRMSINIASGRASTVIGSIKPIPCVRHEVPPKTGSIMWYLAGYDWGDPSGCARARSKQLVVAPISFYEMHLGSWMRVPEDEQPRAQLSRTGAASSAQHVKAARLYPRRDHAHHGASLLWLVGLSGNRLFRAHLALRHAARLHVARRSLASRGDWRRARLAAGAFPQ